MMGSTSSSSCTYPMEPLNALVNRITEIVRPILKRAGGNGDSRGAQVDGGGLTMSFDAVKWVVSLRLKPLHKSVLLSLADRARVINGTLVCYPSYERIAADNRISLRTAKEAVSNLIDMGALSTKNRANKRGHRISNAYILNITKVQDLHSGKFYLSADFSIKSADFALRTISENFDPKAASDKALDGKNQSADFARESLRIYVKRIYVREI